MAIRAMLLGVAVIGGPLWWFSPAHDQQTVDPMVTASVHADANREFTISNMENRTACLIERGSAVTHRSSSVKVDSDCATVWPGLVAARNWTDNGDGTVVISDSAGEEILTLGLGDGVDFVSLEPANAVLALTELN